MIFKTKLSQAIVFAMTGTALSIGSASAESIVSYNAFNHDRSAPHTLVSGGNGTDGWLRTTGTTFVGAGHSWAAGPQPGNNSNIVLTSGNEAVAWVGNDPRIDPGFNYVGIQTLNWSAQIGYGESATVSKNDSFNRYGGTSLGDGTTFNYADIDTAQGAWYDNESLGWKHDSDIGLFKSDVTQQVTLSISSLLGDGDVEQTPRYGFTVFEGMDTTRHDLLDTDGILRKYNHHGSWHGEIDGESIEHVGNNDFQITSANPFTADFFGAGSGLETLILDDVVGNEAVFTAEAGEIYTIILGGFRAGSWTITQNDYELTISSASPVPVPAAAWLFASALTGLVGVQRRKKKSA